jgi:HK97 family phage prohead protease
MIKLIADTLITVDAAAGEIPRRTISGVAVEYGKTATVSDGTRVKFLPGSLSASGKNPKLYMQHDSSQIIGQVVERLDTKEAMLFVAKISATRQGDEALILASDGTIDSVSVGVSVKDFRYEDDIMVIEAATWQELSLVSQPAFEGSIITQVAASIPQTEPEISTIEPEPTQETQPMSEVTPVEAVEATIPTAPIFASANVSHACQQQASLLQQCTKAAKSLHQHNECLQITARFTSHQLRLPPAIKFSQMLVA